jgi:hypothetical protein
VTDNPARTATAAARAALADAERELVAELARVRKAIAAMNVDAVRLAGEIGVNPAAVATGVHRTNLRRMRANERKTGE